MFVRVIRRTEDLSADTIYECERVRFYQRQDNPGEVEVNMEQPDLSLMLDKDSCELYVMNRDGKTIDTYRWK